MKILFITDNFPPESNAPAIRTFEHCKRWVRYGADVTVITCAPNFPTGKVYSGFKNKIYESSIIDNIRVIRVWSYITKNEGFFKRILDYISFSFTSFFAGLFEKFDLVISTSPQFFTSFSGYFLSLFKRKKWIFEVRDLWPESIAAVGSIKKKSFIYKILESIELELYKRSDLIVVVTKNFKQNLVNRGILSNKIKVIYNGVDDIFLSKFGKEERFLIRKNLKLNKKKVIGYIGTIGMAHDLINLIKKIKFLPPKYHLLLIGEGAAKCEIVEYVKKKGLNNVTILDSIHKENVPKYINAIDLSLIQLKKCETFKSVIPSKIFENAAMNKDIILGVEGESKNLVTKYKLGFSFEPGNFKSFLCALKSSENYSKKNLDYKIKFINEFSRANQAKSLFIELKKLKK